MLSLFQVRRKSLKSISEECHLCGLIVGRCKKYDYDCGLPTERLSPTTQMAFLCVAFQKPIFFCLQACGKPVQKIFFSFLCRACHELDTTSLECNVGV